jgi:regulatory protein
MNTDDPFVLAMSALGRREYSRAELVALLGKRGVEEAAIEGVVAELEGMGELDDARFARRYAEDKRDIKGWGADRIRDALRARGVEEADIETAVEVDHESEVDRAVSLIARSGNPVDTDAGRSRALAYLTRRGYPYELAYDAVRACERRAA